MTSSLIRGKFVICRTLDRTSAEIVEGGAIFQQDGVIVDIGPHAELARKYRPDEMLGSNQHVVVPGFVNSHHHIGLTPFQMGAPDLPLELWFASRIAIRDIDPYLDTLYSAFEMIESGVTTVQHLHGGAVRGPIGRIKGQADAVLKAYSDIGMRVSYSFAVRDQNRLVYEADQDFTARLPAELGATAADMFRGQIIPVEDYLALFEQLYRDHANSERIGVQLAPHNLHWCSDRALAMVKACSDKYNVPMHMHLLETKYQKEYGRRRGGGTAVSHLRDVGLLGPSMTLGHGVWLTEGDLDMLADSGTMICHNASSNLRLRSGIAPLNELIRRGVRVAIGMDEANVNDDRNMLEEMRLVLRLHRVPGMDDSVPTATQVLRMATEHGAHTTPFGAHIGTLEIGKAADLSIMSWKHIAHPYLEAGVPITDAIVHRARGHGVETVLVAGEPIMRDRRFTLIDKDKALDELAATLSAPRTAAEVQRMALSKELLPHVRRFYQAQGYLDEDGGEPFYHYNCRHTQA